MHQVYIVGTGQMPVAEHWDRTVASLAAEALAGALGQVAPERVGALYVANALGGVLQVQSQLGAAVASSSQGPDSDPRQAQRRPPSSAGPTPSSPSLALRLGDRNPKGTCETTA